MLRIKKETEIANLLKFTFKRAASNGSDENFPTVIGHSGLDVEGDAAREDIKDSSVNFFR